MRKKLVISGVCFLFVLAAVLYSKSQLKVVSGVVANSDDTPIVLAHKVWKITFSEKMDQSILKDDLIYVTNDKGKKQNVALSLSDDGKTIMIQPPKDGYAVDTEYTLYLDKDIKSAHGKKLKSKKEFLFLVQQNIPVIGSKKNLRNYFSKVIEYQKETAKFFGSEEEISQEISDSTDQANNQDVSETNIQVQGVDEADIVKTDGTHIFKVQDGKVNIIKAVPANEMNVLASISFKDVFSPEQLFLHENQLIVIGHSQTANEPQNKKQGKEIMIAPIYHSVKAIIYDVKDPKNPKQIREVEVEGSIVAARKTDGVVYLIANHIPDLFWALEEKRDIDLRPKFSDTAVSSDIQAVDYDQIQYFPDSNEGNYTIIAAVDLENQQKEASITTYLGSGEEIYMSKNSLYLAVRNDINPTKEEVVVDSNTNIYKFSVNGLNVALQSSTEVEGTVLNQFSMDEYNGYFRIATTKGNAWEDKRPSANNLYILDENLAQVGQLKDLARGERIYSARFMNDRIYIVTFKETDPLFVIDASDPKTPKVLGELKIPGFSNYLHPYDENHLIGFGHDTKIISEKGAQPFIRTNGVKISLFDISDVSNPKEKFTEVIGGSGTSSPLNYDHKALLYHKNKNLFAFPISVYQDVEGKQFDQSFEFQGAYVYNIDLQNGFTLKNKITHTKENAQYEEWENSIDRLVYIGDYLYALSPAKITVHDLKSNQQVGELPIH
ncbi:beta-propeller domain-containing protein [Bacillus aquiflavi]|uniref:Beta-propeller domain-containing protein n=1 Tax=Bacillus aquiflavi TaxID=2672567 RepID=A0A6B3VU23_9BACI|nr:beta-propeller domain-containing protein [Bacillus aquiflavi]MBA4536350.1 beta-propeller domain-containing protein [Bacillus aquiflavi]NEY80718.1 hypothetical protein [Bacillus aquiflavi]UAC48046.1 beta-propeller domain-containing protein [Bacillus aquiflavi]